ncbi:MAG: TonB-dependent receptor domain-containing protein, partial [Longimicrobiales bacterium]
LQPLDQSGGANDGNLLPRRARQSGHLDVDRGFGRLSVGLTMNALGERFDNASNTVRLGGYGTVDLRAEYRIAARWLLQGQADNVFDKRYASVATFGQPGRVFLVTLRYAPRAQ